MNELKSHKDRVLNIVELDYDQYLKLYVMHSISFHTFLYRHLDLS